MKRSRRLQAGIRTTLVASTAWTLLVLGCKTVEELLGIFDAAELVEWVMQRILAIWSEGLILGVIFSAGVAYSRRTRKPGTPSVTRAATLGFLGGLVLALLVMTALKASTFSDFWKSVSSYAHPLALVGSLIGFGMRRTALPPELLSDAERDESRRRTMFRWSAGLSVAFLVDGLLMAWALNDGGYALLGYGQVSLVPVFIPALIASLVLLGMYARGVTRRSWSIRRFEWVFFLIFALAVAAKVVVFVRGDRG